MKLTTYHKEQNAKELEANKRMRKVTKEEFKEQVKRLKENSHRNKFVS